MTETIKNIIQLYTEETPNPEVIKFVLNKILLPNRSEDFPNEKSAERSPLASELFGFPFVQGVFITNNFISITKQKNYKWVDIIPVLKEFIVDYVKSDKAVISKTYQENATAHKDIAENKDATEIVNKIKKILDTRVKPAVEMDGGAIQFKSYEDGIVSLILQGACSNCPSAAITLKTGIETFLKQEIPEIKEVVAVPQ